MSAGSGRGVRPAVAEDAPRLAALCSAVWIATYATEGVTPSIARHVLREFAPEAVAARLADRSRRTWVAEDEGGLVGSAELRLDRSTPALDVTPQAEVDHLYVHGLHARKGWGTRLLAACTERAFSGGVAAVWLAVWARNAGAIAFYDALGWERCGETTYVIEGIAHPNVVFGRRRAR